MSWKRKRSSEIKEMLVQLRALQVERHTECASCGGKTRICSSREDMVVCKWSHCKKMTSIWKGTIFQGACQSKEKIIRILELWMQKAPYNLISYVLRISRGSIRRTMKYLSKILIPKYYDESEMIGGNQEVVEIDESKFGKRKYHRGHRVDGVWIFGMIEKTGKKRIKGSSYLYAPIGRISNSSKI